MSDTKPEFKPFQLYLFDRKTMEVSEVTVTKMTDNRFYIDKAITISRGDRGNSAWLHTPLTPEGITFDTGPTSLKSDVWVVAYGRDRDGVIKAVRERTQREIEEAEKRLKTEKMWFAGFKAVYP